jgi:hypothetical protein
LEDRPRYNKTRCFDTFPFPAATPEQQARIRALAEKLDAHRKARQAQFPDLTMTGMYNVLEALRAGRELTDKEETLHEHGLISILRELHDELDAAVFDAYGWSANLADEDILARLVALNAERIEEEKQGNIRWLRPDYQTQSKEERKAAQEAQFTLDLAPPPQKPQTGAKAGKAPWPPGMLEQLQAVRGALGALREAQTAITPEAIAERFTRAPRARVQEILQALEALGL